MRKIIKKLLSASLAGLLTLSFALPNAKAETQIPLTNTIQVQKLEYKYSKLERTDNVEDKNSIGHPDVHKEIINNPDFNSLDTVATERDSRLGVLDKTSYEGIQNTGDQLDLNKLQTDYMVKKYSPSLYGDVEFSIFQLDRSDESLIDLISPLDYRPTMTVEDKKAFSQAQMKSAEMVGNEIEKAFKESQPLPYGAKLLSTKKLDNSGLVSFANVKTYEEVNGIKSGNIYIIVETKSPATVVTKSKAMFLYLPITNSDGSTYKETVTLYPKNEVKEGTFGFEKHKDDGDGDLATHDGALADVKFKVYKGRPENYTNAVALKDSRGADIVLTTNEKGQIDVNGLVRGQYFLVEIESKNLVDGMTVEATKYQRREGFKYLAGYDSLLNQYNALAFHVDSDGLVRTGSAYNEGKLLNNNNLLEYTNHFIPEFEKIIKSDRRIEQGWDYFENIPFELTFDVPDNIHEYSKYEVKDQLERLGDKTKTSDTVEATDHAEFVKGKDGKIAFEVVNDKGKVFVKGEDYFVTVEEDNKFEISFANPAKAEMKASEVTRTNNRFSANVLNSQKIYVRYHGQLKANADPDILYNNRAEFTYNNGPEKGLAKDRFNNDGKTFKTYGYKFIKHDSGLFNKGLGKEVLEGAEFLVKNSEGLYFNGYNHKDNAAGVIEAVWVKYANDEEAYKALSASEAHRDAILVSDNEGKFEIRGLKSGTYTAVEMKAPIGYRLNLNPETRFEVKESTYTKTASLRHSITNEKSPEMPLTGSEKLVLNMLKGGGILSFGAILIAVNKKKKTHTSDEK